MADLEIPMCDAVVEGVFGPLARDLHLALEKTGAGFFEIASTDCTLRIRVGLGQWTDRGATGDILVTILRSQGRSFNWDNIEGEIGVGLVAEYYGKPYMEPAIGSLKMFEEVAKREASLVRAVCTRLLLGDTIEYKKIEEFMAFKLRKVVEEEKQRRYLPQVQKRWHLPPEPSPPEKEELEK